jgi:hypothetical protein
MTIRGVVANLLGGALLLGLIAIAPELTAGEKEKKSDKDEKRKGTVVGLLTAKGENYVEVTADGEEKARKYVPHWVGGAPAQGGGPDKAMLKQIAQLKVGSRIRLDWEFEERLRVVRVEVLKAPEGKEADEKKTEEKKDKTGPEKRTLVGTLTAKGKNFVEIKADGEEKGRQYFLLGGGSKELLKAIDETPIGTRVQIEWANIERLRVLSLEPLKKTDK